MLNVALCMRIWREVRNFASQKFRFVPVIQPHGVPEHPPFVRQLSQSSFVQRNMLPQFGVVAVTVKNWMLHLNDTLRLITGCLRPTPTGLLPIMADIAPPNLRREQLTYRLGCQAAIND